jgi:peptidoglycan/xylan/chitin deacetylase (PgdA/CDA1 family)
MAVRPRAVILLYHRVASPAMDPLLLSVSPANFAAHLDVLRRSCRILTLAELAAAVRRGAVPGRSAAVTFDDGYADNLDAAEPLLRARSLGGTVFASGACLTGETPYYDELEDLLFNSADLPPRLELAFGGTVSAWNLGAWARLPRKPAADYFAWNLDWADDPTPRHRAYREIFRLLRGAGRAGREEAMRALRRQIPRRPAAGRRLMDADGLRRASAGGALEIGAHARNHLVLAGLPPDEQREEIAAGKRDLEESLGRPVTQFAYPYGSPWDVSEQTVGLVRSAGFALACANTPAPVDRESDLFWLPRRLVRNWSGGEFAARLEEFFRPRAELRPRG